MKQDGQVERIARFVELHHVPMIERQADLVFAETPRAEWKTPAVTTFPRGSHAVRSEGWRYVRYGDGGEELYDEKADPNEWTNLAGDPKYAAVKTDLAKSLLTHNAARAGGNKKKGKAKQ